ncbi:MAG: zinc-binding dehydrogenase [Ktedonobacteraceae bacterium]|nr:zinc-binding dehydrogenase [Ktedonobacteraceae bacterium]MBO0790404.1 zinc-binding dehydrogenase [Ktedonobacteraceae bacterium]
MRRGGRLIAIAEPPDETRAQVLGVSTSFFAGHPSADLLSTFARLIDAGQLRTFVSATFELREADKAHELSQRGHGHGRIILHVV